MECPNCGEQMRIREARNVIVPHTFNVDQSVSGVAGHRTEGRMFYRCGNCPTVVEDPEQ